MKVLRILLIGAGVLAALAVILFATALIPSVQTWAARRIIAGDPSLGVTHVGRVSAGFQRIEISDVTVSRPGFSLTLPSATIELPLISAARGKVHLHNLVAKGWTLDLTTPQPPPATAPVSSPTQITTPPGVTTVAENEAAPRSAGFEGVFKLLDLPMDVAADKIDLEGTVIFPVKPAEPPGRAAIAISGGDLAEGREGRFTIRADVALADGVAPVSHLSNVSTLILKMDTPHSFSRIGVTNESTASGPGLAHSARLIAESTASREGERETYDVVVKNLTDSGEKKLVELHASNPSAKAPITGTWLVDVGDPDVAPFALGQSLPTFTLTAGGNFHADHLFKEVQLTGKTDLATERLDSVYAGLSVLGRIRVQSAFDLAQSSSGVRVNRFSVEVAGKSPVISAEVLQVLEIVPATGEIKVAAPEEDLLRIQLAGLPLAWARPFAPKDLVATGDDLRGEFVARPNQAGVTVRAVSPLVLGNLSVTQAGKPLIEALDLSITASGDYTPAGWQADVSEIAARSAGKDLLVLSVRAGQAAGSDQAIKATGHLRADLAGLLGQPAAADFSVLSRGVAEMDFTASVVAALQQISSKLTIDSLRSKDGTDLPSITIDLRADQHTGGRLEAHVPVVFDLAGRKSDLELAAKLQPAGERWEVDAQLVSNELYVDDLKSFAALQPTPASAPPVENKPPTSPSSGPQPPAEPAPPDSKPVWDAVTGRIKVAMKKVVYAAGQPPVEVSTSVKITPDALTLESFNAAFPDGAAAKADGVIQFQASAPEPYDVNASVTASNVDPVPFLSAANPGTPPTVEGKFDVAGKLTGRTPSLDRLADTAAIDAQLVCRGGRFHGFATSALAANLGKGQEGLSKIASAVSILGSALGKGAVARDADKFKAVSDSLHRLIDFNFDQLNIDIAHRPEEAATQIKTFSLLSPDLRLLGSGTVDNTPGVSLLKRAINLDLQMGVRGQQAEDFRTLNLLRRSEPDPLGYTALSENFPVRGTFSGMAVDSLVKLIMSQRKL